MSVNEIIKCKYAGDPEDEYCSQCDGLNPIGDDGKAVAANLCGGYEPAEQVEEQPAPKQPVSHNETHGESCETEAPDNNCVKGLTSVIRAESGLSVEVNGRWYKFTFSEERILPEGCDVEAEKQALWDSVNAEVDAQFEAVRS